MSKIQAILLILVILIFKHLNFVYAQDTVVRNMTYEAKIAEVISESETEEGSLQILRVEIINKDLAGYEYEIYNQSGSLSATNFNKYQEGDLVVVMKADIAGQSQLYITDYVRRTSLFWLLALFLLVAIIIGKWKSVSSILGLVFSFVIILQFIIPQISSGKDPVFVVVIGSIFILPITFYLSHGVNKKTNIALLGTLIAVVITGILSMIFVHAAKLSGLNSEEVAMLNVMKEGIINTKGLLLAGIIIGTLGVLDDITVSQAAITLQLYEATKGKLSFKEIYFRAMEVGKDHITSMINTLFLVYAGAALPLLLLFTDNPRPFTELINYEPVATELIRTFIGSIGLMSAVPITTFISFLLLKKDHKT